MRENYSRVPGAAAAGQKKSPAGGQALRGSHGEDPHEGIVSIAYCTEKDKGGGLVGRQTAPQIDIRTKNPYTNIPNALIRDKRLRLQTRAVLILMLSLPPDWDYSVRGMAVVAGVSKDTMGRIMGELEETGYLRRRRQDRGEGGRFGRAGFILTDDPAALFEDEEKEESEPCPENADTEAPCPNLPCPEKSPQQIKEQQNTPLPPKGEKRARSRPPAKATADWKPERFEAFWTFYRTRCRGEARQAAIRAWDKLRPSDQLIETMARALTGQLASEEWQRGVGIPYASTWINGRRWEDTPKVPRDTPPPVGGGRKVYGWQ